MTMRFTTAVVILIAGQFCALGCAAPESGSFSHGILFGHGEEVPDPTEQLVDKVLSSGRNQRELIGRIIALVDRGKFGGPQYSRLVAVRALLLILSDREYHEIVPAGAVKVLVKRYLEVRAPVAGWPLWDEVLISEDHFASQREVPSEHRRRLQKNEPINRPIDKPVFVVYVDGHAISVEGAMYGWRVKNMEVSYDGKMVWSHQAEEELESLEVFVPFEESLGGRPLVGVHRQRVTGTIRSPGGVEAAWERERSVRVLSAEESRRMNEGDLGYEPGNREDRSKAVGSGKKERKRERGHP